MKNTTTKLDYFLEISDDWDEFQKKKIERVLEMAGKYGANQEEVEMIFENLIKTDRIVMLFLKGLLKKTYNRKSMKYKSLVDWAQKPICICGKVCFDKKGAMTKVNFLKRRGREKYLRAYQCEMADVWHITKSMHIGSYKRRGL